MKNLVFSKLWGELQVIGKGEEKKILSTAEKGRLADQSSFPEQMGRSLPASHLSEPVNVLVVLDPL